MADQGSSDSELSDTQTQTPVIKSHSNNVDDIPNVWGRLYSTCTHLKPFDLYKPFSLGRDVGCDVVLSGCNNFNQPLLKTISKVHFQITHCKETQITYIKDLSKNGTYVNNVKIASGVPKMLNTNDYISITLDKKLQRIYIYKAIEESLQDQFPLAITTKYAISKFIGKGNYGEVRLLFEKATEQEFAVKIIEKSKLRINVNEVKIKNEINILKTVSHPCIITLNECIETNNVVYLILEYMDGGDLLSRINEELTENWIRIVIYQILKGLQYLHAQGISHRDIKPGNILLNSDHERPRAKIADFGLSRVFASSMMSTICGTPYFIAPEIIDTKCPKYTTEVDIWSLGVMLFLMFAQELPFNHKTQSELFAMIRRGKYEMNNDSWKYVSKDAEDLVKKMLVVNPQDRISIEKIFHHPWFTRDSETIKFAEQIIREADESNSKRRRYEWN